MILMLVSPTRFLIEKLKSKTSGEIERGELLQTWNLCLFYLEVLLCVMLFLGMECYIKYIVLYFAFSRCFEIGYAFYVDALSELGEGNRKSNLKKVDKIKMAMKSYIGLMINYAFIYYLFPCDNFFNEKFDGFYDALYFSGVTITTLGYGDFSPNHWLSKFFVVAEVLSGFILIALAIATYMNSDVENS